MRMMADGGSHRVSRKNHSALRTIPELIYLRSYVPSYHIISHQLSDQMDQGRAIRPSFPPYLPCDGNFNHISTDRAIFKEKRHCGVPCDWCVISETLCVKDAPHSICALCALCGRELRICQEGFLSKVSKRYFKFMIEVLGLQSDSIDLPRTSCPRLGRKRGELSLLFQTDFWLMEISH